MVSRRRRSRWLQPWRISMARHQSGKVRLQSVNPGGEQFHQWLEVTFNSRSVLLDHCHLTVPVIKRSVKLRDHILMISISLLQFDVDLM